MKNQIQAVLDAVKNKIGNHPEVSLLRISHFLHRIKENVLLITTGKRETLKQVQGGFGFITTQKAFTLIELLVVVLIIGILAAIAVPQYEKAVERSKATQALTVLRSAYQAAASHFMATGEYASTFEEMGFEIPWTGTEKWIYGGGLEKDTKSNGEWSLQLYHSQAGAFSIDIGRMSGKYKGAGFRVSVANSSHELSRGIVSCIERTSQGEAFSTDLNAGDYCVKIMNGTVNANSTAATHRLYNLP